MVKKAAKKAKIAAATTKRSAVKAVRQQPVTPALEPLTYRLDALLHTMRCIARHEDELCSLLHDARRTGKVSAPLLRELQAVLDDLPAEEYTHDLAAVRDIAELP